MFFLRKYGFYFLLLGVLSDFLTPYILGMFYPKLNQLTEVMSLFGDVGSPVRQAFLVWSIISGCLYVLAIPALYQTFTPASKSLGTILPVLVGLYGVTDCIFTGLFSVNTSESSWNFSTWIHNVGSGIGYSGFILIPFIIFLLYRKLGETKSSQQFFIMMIVSFLFAGIYGVARIPGFNQLPIFNKLGFCQRISFFFNYLPIAWLSILQIRKEMINRKARM
ncbi:DUF998 domain-containing protein [Enterococcus villorum]|uniref:Membrane protein n=2 Tax=Enterococcus villorum TaxID=112904 RepID=A0A511J4Z1_9ENTE|nr:DUF998 domain-containing protein [Enterococcus villorum]EOH93487.1 hypothetical protein UAO_00216 [Enterococcus villorum ATCC 700913]EOW75438.1 hypothetical protein I591_02527 [Enterococcus villorum ATCC 700913]GEL93077.1 membrane protein [Enterococcus villorum]